MTGSDPTSQNSKIAIIMAPSNARRPRLPVASGIFYSRNMGSQSTHSSSVDVSRDVGKRRASDGGSERTILKQSGLYFQSSRKSHRNRPVRRSNSIEFKDEKDKIRVETRDTDGATVATAGSNLMTSLLSLPSGFFRGRKPRSNNAAYTRRQDEDVSFRDSTITTHHECDEKGNLLTDENARDMDRDMDNQCTRGRSAGKSKGCFLNHRHSASVASQRTNRLDDRYEVQHNVLHLSPSGNECKETQMHPCSSTLGTNTSCESASKTVTTSRAAAIVSGNRATSISYALSSNSPEKTSFSDGNAAILNLSTSSSSDISSQTSHFRDQQAGPVDIGRIERENAFVPVPSPPLADDCLASMNFNISPSCIQSINLKSKDEEDGPQVVVSPFTKMPYVHGSYAAAAPIMLRDERWMDILRRLMPESYAGLVALIRHAAESVPSPSQVISGKGSAPDPARVAKTRKMGHRLWYLLLQKCLMYMVATLPLLQSC